VGLRRRAQAAYSSAIHRVASVRAVPRVDAERYWDDRAREHALFFVDNRLDYRNPDVDRFWADGERVLDQMLELVGVAVAPSDVVLDIGCGVGRLTRALAGRAERVIGLDVSREMLARAAELNPQLENVEWRHGDGRSLTGVGTGTIDACVSHVVFQHLPDPALTLGYVREMGRVLRPGGWAAFQVSTDPSIHRPRGAARRLAARFLPVRGPAARAVEHPAWLGSAVEPEDLRRAAAGAGLTLERMLGVGSQFTTVLARR
jgi:SAM-dependent methyltransferase